MTINDIYPCVRERNGLGLCMHAGLRLDDDVKIGLISAGMRDKSIVSGILQTAIMDCFYDENVASKYPKLNDKGLAAVHRLGPFTRSILAAIINRVYSNICGKH